ncbi:MAG TPA: hypothetical protein VGV17_15920 [Bosea sp. (in: a-proteobacteria)]|jgi:hypothetical protein|uniref:hypothetical protein n=1 Tax=Bosea sp. (in: a-proteobacteria) TaxID=1871050 RepID=UPI002DDD9147|nr:hypothetical protein [Bosea sp. (in: a-proteobacteria)]HEV2555242.1 hypothetical protein [Bosea sp. (in: a-proteobacteria)]
MMKLATRIAKLEAIKGARSHLRLVTRHVIAEPTEAERQARIKAILAASDGNVFRVFRVIVKPIEGVEEGATIQ